MKDIFYMKQAIKLAKKGIFTTSPNPNVGCIIVNNNVIVGSGWHKKTGMNHAEIYALKIAGKKAKGATAYITLEPCSHFGKTPPCCVELTNFGVTRVVIATLDPNPKVSGQGLKWLKDKGVLITLGILSNESKKINKGFFQRMKTGQPWIKVKLASSLDGRIALSNGKSKWITSKSSRQDVQNLRKYSDAIISSSSTILADDPLLTVRKVLNSNNYNNNSTNSFSKKIKKQPIRVIIDSKNRVKPSNKCILQPGKTLLARLYHDNNFWPKNIEQIILNPLNNKVNLIDLIKILGKRNINNILVEAGASLSSAFLKLDIVNELIIYIAPKLLGNFSKPLFILDNYTELFHVPQFIFNNVKQIGTDIKLTLTKKTI